MAMERERGGGGGVGVMDFTSGRVGMVRENHRGRPDLELHAWISKDKKNWGSSFGAVASLGTYDIALEMGKKVICQRHYSLSFRSRTQCTRLPLYAGSGRGECRLALPPFMERLLSSLEPETYRSWAKALAIAPRATSKLPN
ncbi:hypothetical protein DVH24_032471 [Malus domestica]|uniref:Uncharacterized protein n=1 Tax=Malus domestica TaxID=3750 RepID=A0A498J7E9_MALDO|nr:hypothetical protein DVH24_032471 [Malus domestica]